MPLSFLFASLLTAQPADAIDDYVAKQMASQHIPGLTLLVVRDGEILKRKAYGLARLEGKKPVEINTKFDMGSIGKTFTAVMIMQLVEQGKLKLQDPVSLHIPNWPKAWEKITIRDLLSHQSGLPEYAVIEKLTLDSTYKQEEWNKIMFALPLDFEPGTIYQYSNSNFVVLGMILEAKYGKRYPDLAKERVFRPAGMTDTLWRSVPGALPRGAADGYFYQNEFQNAGAGGISPIQSDGGAFTTVDDLAKFHAALQSGSLIKPATLKKMQTGSALPGGRTAGYGLGFMVKGAGGQPVISHGGNSVGFSATYTTFPKLRMQVYMLCNLYPIGGDDFAINLVQELYPKMKAKPLVSKPDPHPDLTKSLIASLQKFASGATDSEEFSKEFKARIATPRGKMALPAYAAFKEIKGVEFIQSRKSGPDRAHQYRIVVGTGQSWIIEFYLDKASKIYALGRFPDPGKG